VSLLPLLSSVQGILPVEPLVRQNNLNQSFLIKELSIWHQSLESAATVVGATKFRLRRSKKLENAGSNKEANVSQFLLLSRISILQQKQVTCVCDLRIVYHLCSSLLISSSWQKSSVGFCGTFCCFAFRRYPFLNFCMPGNPTDSRRNFFNYSPQTTYEIISNA
jgi:hypothetical protein